MKTSQVGLDLIKSFEGCRLTAYQCAAGVWTIGYGHTSGVKAGDKITQAQADAFLASDVARFEANVEKFDSIYHWTQNQFDAMVSFAFNLGSINKLTANGTKTKEKVADDILLYNKAAGKVLAGLQRRRQAERDLFMKGGIGESGTVSTKKSAQEIANEIINGQGDWGNGAERRSKLTAAGYDYDEIQSIINSTMPKAGNTGRKSATEVAKEIALGKGNWGTGATRRKRVTDAGYNYAEVQAIVNRLMKK